MKAKVRLFLSAPMKYQAGTRDWTYLSLRYLKAFKETGTLVRAVAMPPGVDLSDDESPWYNLADMFTAEIDDNLDTNIVVGFGGVFEKYYTEGLRNIAITASYPRPQRIEEIRVLEKFQAIWAVTQRTRNDLAKIGLTAHIVPPEPLILKAALNNSDYMKDENEANGTSNL